MSNKRKIDLLFAILFIIAIISRPQRMTDGCKMDLLSFIGWMLLVFVTFGIASIWVVPYTETTNANAYLKGKRYSDHI